MSQDENETKRTTKYEREIVENVGRNRAIADLAILLIDAGEQPGIIFCRWKQHAYLIHKELHLVMPESEVITSDVNRQKRETLAQAMREGTLDLVVSTDVWATGIDIPNLKWVILAAEGMAPISLKQKGGRPTRLSPEKEGYTIYNICSEGWTEQGEIRQKHLAEAGFNTQNSPRRILYKNRDNEKIPEDIEAQWVSELLDASAAGTQNSHGGNRETQPESDLRPKISWTYNLVFYTCFFIVIYLLKLLMGGA